MDINRNPALYDNNRSMAHLSRNMSGGVAFIALHNTTMVNSLLQQAKDTICMIINTTAAFVREYPFLQ